MLFWVKFLCPAGDSSSCAMVVMCTGTSIVYCSSDESPPTYIHSFTRMSRSRRLESSLHTIDPLRHFFLFPGALKCWCGTIATMFSQAPKRDSQDLCFFFPRGCTFSMAKTIACYPCQLSTSDLHYSCWQSCENCQVVSAGAFTLLCHAFWFSLKGCFSPCFSFLFCLAVLPTCYLFHDSRLFGLTLRPSSPVCSCHRDSLTRGRLAFAQEAVRDSPSLFP